MLTQEQQQQRHRDISENVKSIYYSPKYQDDIYEYRHVILPKPISKWLPENRLMPEDEWRGLGVQQSLGWVHYMVHRPEPHILLFRRSLAPEAVPAGRVGGMAG